MDDAQERKIATEVREGFEANDKKLRKSYGKDIEKYLKKEYNGRIIFSVKFKNMA